MRYYTIVKATGGVSGTFRGVPDGAVVVASNGTKFTISYKADGGTAVVLIAAGTGGPLPQVSGVGPAAGLAAGGTLVTITGSNLANAVSVNFGTTAVTSFASDSATQIVVMSPAGSGAVDVTVGTVSGTSSASSADEFSFVAALAQFAFSSPAVTVNENAGAATLTVVRSGGYEGATSVLVFTYGGTALGANYTPLDQVLNFAAGQNSQSVTIAVKSTRAQTTDLTANVALSNPGYLASLGSPATAVLTISPVVAPLVTMNNVQLVFNNAGKVSEMLISFSGAINTSEGRRLKTYAAGDGRQRRSFAAKNAKQVKLRSAVYDAATNQVLLRPAAPFALTEATRLVVYGTGPDALSDSEGRLIDGNDDGGAGGNAMAVLTSSGATIEAVAPG